MNILQWEKLPENMKNDTVRKYYEKLYKKRGSLIAKRIFDILMSLIALIISAPLFLIISIAIKIDSQGPIMFRQIRVTQYGREFKIFKFRTMVDGSDRRGLLVTTDGDNRITNIGAFLRKYRLDEIPQLLNILRGDMSFVGTRPEVVKYVNHYTEEMRATLLLPAGVTSVASIQYKDENLLLKNADNADKTYIEEILPEKMKHNLRSLENFSFISDLKTIFETVTAVFIGRSSETKKNAK